MNTMRHQPLTRLKRTGRTGTGKRRLLSFVDPLSDDIISLALHLKTSISEFSGYDRILLFLILVADLVVDEGVGLFVQSHGCLNSPAVSGGLIELGTKFEADLGSLEGSRSLEGVGSLGFGDLDSGGGCIGHLPHHQANSNSLHVLVEVLRALHLVL